MVLFLPLAHLRHSHTRSLAFQSSLAIIPGLLIGFLYLLRHHSCLLELLQKLAVLVLDLDQLFDFFPRVGELFNLALNRLLLVVKDSCDCQPVDIGHGRLCRQHLTDRLKLISTLSLHATVLPGGVPVHRRCIRTIVLLRAKLTGYLAHGVLGELVQLLQLLQLAVLPLLPNPLPLILHIFLAFFTIFFLPHGGLLVHIADAFVFRGDGLLSVRPAVGRLGKGSVRFKLFSHFKLILLLLIALCIDYSDSSAIVHRRLFGKELSPDVVRILIQPGQGFSVMNVIVLLRSPTYVVVLRRRILLLICLDVVADETRSQVVLMDQARCRVVSTFTAIVMLLSLQVIEADTSLPLLLLVDNADFL